jgi:hypothetical protein
MGGEDLCAMPKMVNAVLRRLCGVLFDDLLVQPGM